MRAAALTLFAAAALLAPARGFAETPKLDGAYGFDWLKPEKSRCAKITGALLAKLQSKYACGPGESDSASGVKILAVCKAKQGRSEYLLFAAEKDCKEERETQLANAE